MLRFYLPLASTVVLITVTHSIIDAGLARFPNPAEVLAGYAVAKSIALVLENPMFMVRQTTVSLVRDRSSFRIVRLSVLGLSLYFFALIAAVAYIPPLTRLFLGSLMGLEGEAFNQARAAVRVMPFLPLATGWRNFQHGLAILKKGNDLLPIATVARLGYLLLFLFVVAPLAGWHGAVAGSVAFVGGIAVEMVVMAIGLNLALRRTPAAFIPLRPKPSEHTSGGGPVRKRLGWRDLGEFFMPLAATSLITTGTLPLINGFIARGSDPAVALAAYAVALSLGQTLNNPLSMLHQVVLSYRREDDPASGRPVVRFVAGAAAVCSGAVAVVAFSPLGEWLLRGPMSLPREVARPAQACLGLFVLVGLATAVREYFWGLLMQRRRTGSIGRAKAATIVVMALILAAGLAWTPHAMAFCAALSFTAAAVTEALILSMHARRSGTRPIQAAHGA